MTVTGGSGATVQVARYGQVPCVLDTNSMAGHLAIMGTTTNCDCADAGTNVVSGVAIGARVVGYFLQTATAGTTALVELTPGLVGTEILACR
ncbi:MAG TPA: hypothetical protein VMT86_06590 [Bryobacteraceae bacterium]|nr:hypothetical protein [Bryobacteraceae bacterium]